MKGFRRFLLLVLALVLLCGMTVHGAQDEPQEIPLSTWEFDVLRIVNKERMTLGLDPVTAFDAIQAACDIRANELQELFSHTRPDGTACWTAFDEAGVDYWYAGENIAAGYRTPAAVMDGWMNSEGHRANILTAEFTHMGVGYQYDFTHEWVQMFCSLYSESYTSAAIVVPSTADVGTSIDEMYIYATLENSACGKCYLPIMSEFVVGYDPSLLGTQTCQAEFLGYTLTFDVTLVSPCADGHSYESVVTDPTCTDPGYTTHTCSECGDSYTDSHTAPTGHSFSSWYTVERAGCTTSGTQRRDCVFCGRTEEKSIPAAGHSYYDEVTDPTCTDPGFTTHTCFACGYSYTDSHIAPTGHSFTPAAGKDPTCTEDGYVEYACCLCWDLTVSYQVTVPATGHSYESDVTAPTCSGHGYTTHTCAHCGDSYDDSYTDPIGHSYGSWTTIKEPTCTASGTQLRSCENCCFTQEQTVPATGHLYEADVTAPSCTQRGYTVHTCVGCGDSYVDSYTDPTGHSYGDDGICTACQDVRLAITVQPTGQKVKAGTKATYAVTAQGEGLTYQWQYRTGPKAKWKNCTADGNDTDTMEVSATRAKSGNQYRCVILDGSGNRVTTKTVYLYVLGIKTQPSAQKVKAGTTVKFTVAATGFGKTYQWQYKAAGGTWTNCTGKGNKTATMSFTANAAMSGRQYRCVVRDSAGNSVTTRAVYLYVLGIRNQPTSRTAAAGSTVKFTVNAAGHNKSYQWQYKNAKGVWVNATGSGNKTATLKVTAKASFNGRLYRCIIRDSAGHQVITRTAKLTVTKPAAPTPDLPDGPTQTTGTGIWIPTNGGTKYHSHSGCSGMIDPIEVTLEEALRLGFTACKRCH